MNGLRRQISKRKNAEKLSWLDSTDKTLSVVIKITFFAPMFGGALLLRYLIHIGKPNLFMPAVSSLNGLVALLVGSILVCLVIAISLLMPYWVARFVFHEHMKLFPTASVPRIRILLLFLSFPAMLVASSFWGINFWLLLVLVVCQALIVLQPLEKNSNLTEFQFCRRWLFFVIFIFIFLGFWNNSINPWLFYALYISLFFLWIFQNKTINQINSKTKGVLHLIEWRKEYYVKQVICQIKEWGGGTWSKVRSYSFEHNFNWTYQLLFLTLSATLLVFSYDVINKISTSRGAEEWLTIGLLFTWSFVMGTMLIAQFNNKEWKREGQIFGIIALFIVLYFNLEIANGATKILGIQSDVKKWYWVANIKKLENILPDSICQSSNEKGYFIYAATQFSYGNTIVLCATGSSNSCKDNSIPEKTTLDHCVTLNNSEIRLTDAHQIKTDVN